ncbi:GNAT family N-acetyltransferase [Ruegeria atlantica]|uniref:Putative N-acetyltransferase YafP n=1 Tax=Ruegeria atlantica TaxID=81569 RepID=A0A0P1EHX6_9RHOB|nr:GNAT family N-acetyltransferase [Ruegeria atlantica]CUH50029.1 putative N-acetyltransferase YafP [Ruegeria atlantica]
MLRRATVFDEFDLSRVLVRSITELCTADHQDDPKVIAQWVANKDPETIRGWIRNGAQIWLAEKNGQPAAVGGLTEAGEITLLYIDPDHIGWGIGGALLKALEQELIAFGCTEGQLEATQTAQGFYARHGWETTGGCSQRNDVSCLSMRKSLHLQD